MRIQVQIHVFPLSLTLWDKGTELGKSLCVTFYLCLKWLIEWMRMVETFSIIAALKRFRVFYPVEHGTSGNSRFPFILETSGLWLLWVGRPHLCVKIKHWDKFLSPVPGDQRDAFSFNSADSGQQWQDWIEKHCALLFYRDKSRHPAVRLRWGREALPRDSIRPCFLKSANRGEGTQCEIRKSNRNSHNMAVDTEQGRVAGNCPTLTCA